MDDVTHSTPTIPHDMIGRHVSEIDQHDVDWYQLWPQVDAIGQIIAIVDASDIDALGLVGVYWSDRAGCIRLGDEDDCDVYARREEVQSSSRDLTWEEADRLSDGRGDFESDCDGCDGILGGVPTIEPETGCRYCPACSEIARAERGLS